VALLLLFSAVGIPKLQSVYVSKDAIGTVSSDSDVGTRTGVKKNVQHSRLFILTAVLNSLSYLRRCIYGYVFFASCCRENQNTHFMYSDFFVKHRAVCEIKCKKYCTV
jgi:hypothetical protein